MVVGYNHNFRYKGVLYHVQTEDGGRNSPAIITHLFTGGTILSSKKTSYADILKIDRLESVVEELMKEQHREMLRRLRDGELDATISARTGAAPLSKPVSAGVPASAGKPLPAPSAERPALASPPSEEGFRPAAPVSGPVPAAARQATTPDPPPAPEPATGNSLDDVILAYLLGDGGKKP